MECPESIEKLDELEKLIPLCKVTLYEQAQARLKSGAAKSEREASQQIAEELDKSPGSIRRQIQRGKEEAAQSAPLNLTDSDKATILKFGKSIQKEQKEQRQSEIQKEREVLSESAEQVPPSERWHVECADIKTWQAPHQYDFIITDPPYPKEYLPLYSVLAKRATEWLRPGGLLIAMCGQSYVNQIYQLLSENLKYYWTACYLTPGQPTPLRQINVNTTWKPLLIYQNGSYNGKTFGDVFKSEANDKSFHKWGQSESGMRDVISKICLPGQHILDPFLGAGTTGLAAIEHDCFFDGIDIEDENVKIAKVRLYDKTKK